MKSTDHNSPKKKSNKLILAIASIVLILIVGLLGYVWFKSTTTNYAEEVAKQLEDALVNAGAVKVCSRGDAGRGVDNREPWYISYFKINEDNEKTTSLIQAAAKENDYTLERTADGVKGYLGEMVYMDSHKQQDFAKLKQGNIQLAIALSNSALHACSDSSIELNGSETNTIISLEVRLPEYR